MEVTMKNILKTTLIIALVIAAIGGMIWSGSFAPGDVGATTSNPSSASTGYQLLVMPISAVSATTNNIISFKVPWSLRVLTFSVVQPTNFSANPVNFDLKNAAGTSLLSSAVTVSTVATEATLTTNSSTLTISDESTLSISTSGTGTAGNVTVLLGIKRQ